MKAKFIIAIISTLFLASSGYNFINNNVNKLQEKQSDNTSFNEEVKVDKIITENNLFNNKGNGYINNIKVNEDEVNLLNKDVSASENNINQYIIDINKPSIDDEKTSNNKENSLTDNSITEDNKSDIGVEDNNSTEDKKPDIGAEDSNITEDNKSDIDSEDSNSNEDNKSDIDVEDSSNNNESTIDKEKVENIINLINEINTEITFDDEKVLEDVQNQYLLLNSEEKKLVTNYSKLESAQTKMEDIKKQIFRVYNLINNIPEDITINNLDEAERAIVEAEQAYNLLPEESKKGISSTTYSIMSMSKEQVKRLRDSIENAENEKVKAMEVEIENLPELSDTDISDYDKVKNADVLIKKVLNDFNSLPQELKNAVSNQEKLGKAYEKITYLKAKIIEKEISQIDLKKVTEADRGKLEALDNAYKNLNRIGQLLVSNYQHLRTAIVNLDINK